MGGELRELLDEVHETIHAWWAHLRAPRVVGNPDDLGPDNDEIVFHPTSSKEGSEAALAEDNIICPVTRLKLDRLSGMYRCERCGIRYSPEGWLFLRETDRGACCSCKGIGTVRPVVKIW